MNKRPFGSGELSTPKRQAAGQNEHQEFAVDGQRFVRIFLSNASTAFVIDHGLKEKVLTAGIWRQKNTGTPYIVTGSPDRYLGKLILGPSQPNEHVAHRNGDRYDFRRCNLHYTKGIAAEAAKGRASRSKDPSLPQELVVLGCQPIAHVVWHSGENDKQPRSYFLIQTKHPYFVWAKANPQLANPKFVARQSRSGTPQEKYEQLCVQLAAMDAWVEMGGQLQPAAEAADAVEILIPQEPAMPGVVEQQANGVDINLPENWPSFEEAQAFAKAWLRNPESYVFWLPKMSKLMGLVRKVIPAETESQKSSRRRSARLLVAQMLNNPLRQLPGITGAMTGDLKQELVKLEQAGHNIRGDATFGSEAANKFLKVLAVTASTEPLCINAYPREIVRTWFLSRNWLSNVN